MKSFKAIFVLTLFLQSAVAQATVSAYAEFYIPYQRLQSEYVCLNKQIMNAEFGIPLFSTLTGILNPSQTLVGIIGQPITYQNINLLVNGTTKITSSYIHDNYTSSNIVESKLSIDMAAFDALNSNTTAGRQKTINTAKLAIIAIIKTAESLHGSGNFRVWVKVDNLPSQTGLSGTPVLLMSNTSPSTGTIWPYTSSSSVIQSYINDVISPNC